MKKNSILALFLLWGSVMLFSFEETWTSAGFEFGNYIEHSADGTAYFGAPGFTFNTYAFADKKDIGFFAHFSFLFPVIAKGDADAGNDFQFDWIVGPGFRYSFNENLKFKFGIGINCVYARANYTENTSSGSVDYSKSAVSLGIGADAGIKYDITDYFYITGGITFSCLFVSIASRYSYSNRQDDSVTVTTLFDGRVEDFVSFGIKPYICIGYNYYQEKGTYGKPKK